MVGKEATDIILFVKDVIVMEMTGDTRCVLSTVKRSVVLETSLLEHEHIYKRFLRSTHASKGEPKKERSVE